MAYGLDCRALHGECFLDRHDLGMKLLDSIELLSTFTDRACVNNAASEDIYMKNFLFLYYKFDRQKKMVMCYNNFRKILKFQIKHQKEVAS